MQQRLGARNNGGNHRVRRPWQGFCRLNRQPVSRGRRLRDLLPRSTNGTSNGDAA